MKTKLLTFLAGASIAVFAGCTTRVADFTVASTKNIDLNNPGNYTIDTTRRVTGKDSTSIIIFVPTGIPNVKEAGDRAIESIPGCVGLANVVVYNHSFYIPLIFGKNELIVEGDPIFLKSNMFSAKSK